MGLSRIERLAAGQVYDMVGSYEADIDHIEINGQRVEDLDGALYDHYENIAGRGPQVAQPLVGADQIAFREALYPQVKAMRQVKDTFTSARTRLSHTWVGAATRKVSKGVHSVTDAFVGSRVGRAVGKYLSANHERVSDTVQVAIVLENGRRAVYAQDMEDFGATHTLKRIGLIPQKIAMIPNYPLTAAVAALHTVIPHAGQINHYLLWVGQILAGTTATAAIGSAGVIGAYSGVQMLLGRPHLGLPYVRALARTATKHVVIGANHCTPIVGGAFPLLSVLRDQKDKNALSRRG